MRLCICAGSSELLLCADVVSIKILCAGQYGIFFSFVNMNVTPNVPFLVHRSYMLITSDYRVCIFAHLLQVVKI